MPITVKDLPPCTILTYNVSRHGGQRYTRENEATYTDPVTGEEVCTWDTKKSTKDPKEFKEAASIQTKTKYALGKLGAHSPLGVILRRDKREEAERVVEELEAKIAEFNSRARYTTIDAMIMVFDVEGRNIGQLEKILDQMYDVLGELGQAMDTLDPENIRAVLRKVAGYSEILPDAAAEDFDRAVENAKRKANEISKFDKRAARIAAKIEEEVNGRSPEEVLEERQRELLKAQRTSYEKVPELRERAFALKKLIGDQEDTLKRLFEARATVNRSAIDRARFAVMKRRPALDVDDAAAARLQGAQQSVRFARLGAAAAKAAANDVD